MAFSESSLPLSLGSFIMICESMVEMLLLWSLTCLAEPYASNMQNICLKSNKVFIIQCLALKIKDKT